MGLVISIQEESGNQIDWIADDSNFLHRLLPKGGSNLLAGIDWYGDTVFNGQQMAQFIPMWKELSTRAQTIEEKTLVSVVNRFAEECAAGTHLYLKFIGD